MDYQTLFNNIMALNRMRETTMRIGEALKQLEKLPKNAEVEISMEWVDKYKEYINTFDDKEYIARRISKYDKKQMYFDKSFGSDRGDYANMYLGYTYEPTKTTVQDLIDILNNAKKQGTMYGYKGGEFDIDDSTLLTIAEYGYSEGIRPTNFELIGDKVIMHTKYKE